MIDVTEHLALAQYMTNKYYCKYRHMYEYDDFKQVAYLGLVKAANKFDENLGFKFSTFAVKTIFGEIMRFVQDDKRFNKSRGIPIDIPMISFELGNENGQLENVIAGYDFEEELMDKLSLEELTRGLSEQEKKVFKLYYLNDLTQTTIAKMIKTSPVQVSRIKRRVYKKLKSILSNVYCEKVAL